MSWSCDSFYGCSSFPGLPAFAQRDTHDVRGGPSGKRQWGLVWGLYELLQVWSKWLRHQTCHPLTNVMSGWIKKGNCRSYLIFDPAGKNHIHQIQITSRLKSNTSIQKNLFPHREWSMVESHPPAIASPTPAATAGLPPWPWTIELSLTCNWSWDSSAGDEQ